MIRRTLLLILWGALLVTTAWAAPGLDIEARVEPSEPLPFGKPATLVLNLSWDEKWTFQPPPAEDLDLPGLTVIDRYSTDSSLTTPGRKGITYNLIFTRFEPGKAEIPPVSFETPSGNFASPKLSIDFKGAVAKAGDKPDELRGPKGQVELSTRDWWIWLAKVVAGVLLALVVLGFVVSKLGFLERWLSPRSRALRQLSRLAKALEKETTTPPEALLQMVEITRLYLRRAYGLVTREATSREISEQMTMTNRCQNIKPMARAVLDEGDTLKFAQRPPSPDQVLDLLEQLRAGLKAERKS